MSRVCPKAGIKIHETPNSNMYNIPDNQLQPKSGLETPVNFYNTRLNNLDLDIDNYSLEDLYQLFNITNQCLTEENLKSAKQIVLKMHPDKSKLDAKYFLFFSKSYKRLYGVYEFQNKSTNKRYKDEDFYDETNINILDNVFEKNKELKNPKNFNNWFNEKFEKHRIEDPNEQGYGNWLKSNDDFITMDENVTKGNMNEVFEKKKKQIQAVTVYTGVTDMFANSLGGSLLDNSSNDFSTEEYTDLRNAYTQTLIPVTNDDYEKVQKFNSLSEYKKHRDNVNMNNNPLSKEESMRKLLSKESEREKHSAALAYKYALESEKAKQKHNDFWSDIKQLTGW